MHVEMGNAQEILDLWKDRPNIDIGLTKVNGV
jgi:hypothetical protein